MRRGKTRSLETEKLHFTVRRRKATFFNGNSEPAILFVSFAVVQNGAQSVGVGKGF
jgi:hypothetical protein